MSRRYFVIVAFALSMACAATLTGPPEIVVDQSACSHCGMLVSEPMYAAAYRIHGKEPRVFDDISCMLTAIRAETPASVTVWLQDAAGTGWLDGSEAIFVSSPKFRTPMSGGVLAYADAAAAEKAARANDGRVMRSLAELMAWNGDAR